jgi:hypothetical protein
MISTIKKNTSRFGNQHKTDAEVSAYWALSRNIHMNLEAPEIVDYNIFFYLSRANYSTWFVRNLRLLQEQNSARYDVSGAKNNVTEDNVIIFIKKAG